ncbi:MAG: GatB/YqeY domain-containing protein [Planctomycetes bacterium]|nr:GatB/YqeY domain-containing protein [Planctomycetota bacterium]
MKQQIQDAMRAAMKAGDKVRVSALRMLMADIMNAELAGQQVMDAIVGYGKRLEKSIAEYARLGQHERVEQLKAEHAVVSEFMPRKLSDEELEALVDRTIAEENLQSAKDMGRGMKAIMSAHGSQVEGQKVQQLLKQKLSE